MLILGEGNYSIVGNIIIALLLCGVAFLVMLLLRKIIVAVLDGLEMVYALFCKRPIFIHFYPLKKDLTTSEIFILKQQFTFYNRLEEKHQQYFRHRVATFLKKKQFEGMQGFEITQDVKILVASTAVMLTFGFRNYLIPYIEKIVIYPTIYYSRFSKTTNKGEFNARLKTMVLSWDNFVEGHKIEDDKLNLGIHEFAHAIHFSSIKSDDINAILFVDTFNELRNDLTNNSRLKQDLAASELIRDYAFTNDSELLAVVIETFIESPKALKTEFPTVYSQVKQMLNFNFAGY
ncbi:zinc-dependent peptidase [Flavobacteriaceae bacterium MHTCC 0001]